MEIGISSSCFYPMLTEDAFLKVCTLGAKTAEIFFNSSVETKMPLLQNFLDIKNEYGVSVNSIHPFTSFAEPFMLFGSYERRVREGVDFYRNYFEAAAALGARAVVLHGANAVRNSDEEKRYTESYNLLCDAADEFGVSPAVEIVVKRMGQSLDFLKLLKENSGGRFRTVLDIKQCRRSRVSEYDFIKEFADDIVQVHLSDYNETLDCIPPGEGRYDFKKLFNTLKDAGYDQSAVIELYNWSYYDEKQIENSRFFLESF